MAGPLDLDTIMGEFTEQDPAWIPHAATGKYVTIPHLKYPGRNIFHFFMSQSDCEKLISELVQKAPALKGKRIEPFEVKLKMAIRGIANSKNPDDGFVVHTPNEVFEHFWKTPN